MKLNIKDTRITDKALKEILSWDFSMLRELRLSKECWMQVDSNWKSKAHSESTGSTKKGKLN